MLTGLTRVDAALTLAQHVAVARQAGPPDDMHPAWIVTLVVAVVLPGLLFVFLALHLIVTVLLMGRPYEFPIKVVSRGPWYCPHCGKATAGKRVAGGLPPAGADFRG
jgi:hypothetical protein